MPPAEASHPASHPLEPEPRDHWLDKFLKHAPIPADLSLQSFFERQADLHPAATALLAGSRSFTYQELDRHANALASELQRNGVKRETLVGICAERRAETIIAILAVLKAGGAYVPIDPKYPKDRIAYILKDAAAPILLTQKSLEPSLPQEDGSRLFIDDVLLYTSDRLAPLTHPEDLAYIIYTSGSTGQPKGVAIEHRNAIAFIHWAKSAYQPEDLAGVLFSTSICFDVSIFEMFATLASGGTLILAENALDLHNHPHRDAITLLSMVPSAMSEILDANLIPPNVKVINLAGEALTATLADRTHQTKPGVILYDLYGPSEDTTYSTFGRREPGARASIGRPISNTKAYIVNEQVELQPPGIAGELLLGGAGLARGYLHRPELTAEKFITHPEFGRLYRTGDRARFFENGELQFLGRLDHQIKLCGHRIELGEIESLLESHPSVSKAIAHANEGRLVAHVTTAATSGTDIWQDQWDMLYSSAIEQTGGRKLDTLDSVIAGWAGVENLDAQVGEWISSTVDRIRDYRPGRVFEIGCGTGQLLSRLAPDAECYWAADISKVAIDALENSHPLPQVKLLHRPADDLSDIPDAHFDTVIINSVAQYFPDADYLLRVLQGAARTLKPGGRIFLGDIHGKALLATHHAMALRWHAPAGTTAGELRDRAARRIELESELSLDPAWFDLTAPAIPGISQVEILLRRGGIVNETTAYHYDVVLHVVPAPATRKLPQTTPWKNLEQLEAMLSERPVPYYLTGIQDARLASPLAFHKALDAAPADAMVPEPRPAPVHAVSAEALFDVARQYGYRAHVRWSGDGTSGLLDAVLFPAGEIALPAWPVALESPPASTLANTPHASRSGASELPQALRKHLAAALPEYMIPSAIVVIDTFPLTPNGKLDRKALTVPADDEIDNARRLLTAPRNETESSLLEIWKQVLGKDGIGVEDDIFTLGGDSILIFQITTRASRAGIRISPAQMFRLRTIAAIAAESATSAATPTTPTIQRVNRDSYRRNL